MLRSDAPLQRLADNLVFAIHPDFSEGNDDAILASDCSQIFWSEDLASRESFAR